jgi:hypothetical protein
VNNQLEAMEAQESGFLPTIQYQLTCPHLLYFLEYRYTYTKLRGSCPHQHTVKEQKITAKTTSRGTFPTGYTLCEQKARHNNCKDERVLLATSHNNCKDQPGSKFLTRSNDSYCKFEYLPQGTGSKCDNVRFDKS